MKTDFTLYTLNIRMWVLASSEASGLLIGPDARMLYSLYWYPVFLALASNVPQVTIPDISARLHHSPSVSTNFIRHTSYVLDILSFCKNPKVHTHTQQKMDNAV